MFLALNAVNMLGEKDGVRKEENEKGKTLQRHRGVDLLFLRMSSALKL